MSKIYLLLLIFLIFSCKGDDGDGIEPIDLEPEEEIKVTNPVVEDIEVLGKEVTLIWSHETTLSNIDYKILLDSLEYTNPDKTLAMTLDYESTYAGEIIAYYPNGEQSSVDFSFETPKSEVLFYTSKNTLYAIDLYTKKTLWRYDKLSPSNTHGIPVIYNNNIICGNEEIVALNIMTGKEVWKNKPDLIDFTTAFRGVHEDNLLYMNGSYFYSYYTFVLDLNTGAILWGKTIGGELFMGEYLYTIGGGLYSYTKDGERQWIFNLDYNPTSAGGYISSQPVIFENNIYFGDNIGRIYSVDADNGSKNWSIDVGLFNTTTGDPTIYNNALIIPVRQNVYSIDTETSRINWGYTHPSGIIYSAPFIVNDIIIFGTASNGFGSVVAINANTGKLIWETNGIEQILESPVVYKNKVYIGSRSKFYEIDLETGEITYTFDDGASIFNSPVIVVGDAEKIIYSNASGTRH